MPLVDNHIPIIFIEISLENSIFVKIVQSVVTNENKYKIISLRIKNFSLKNFYGLVSINKIKSFNLNRPAYFSR